MDHSGEDILGGLLPDLAPPEMDDALLDDASNPNIDVPFTPSAQRILDHCSLYVDRAGNQAKLVDLMMLAFQNTRECAVAHLLPDGDLMSEDLLARLEHLLGGDLTVTAPDRRPNVDPRLERVIIRAKRDAFRRSHPEVSSIHLLWALIRERSGAQVYAWERAAVDVQRFGGGGPILATDGPSD